MEQACVDVMETILAFYSVDLLPLIFDSVPEAKHLRSRYTLTQEYITQQSLSGQNSLKRNLSPVYSELTEISRVQEQLMAAYPQVQSVLGDGQDGWGNMAMGFGSGALAVANPLIGVPLLIYRWANENKKGDFNNAFVANWCDRFVELCRRWDGLDAMYKPIYESQCRFIVEKINAISENAVLRILTELDAEGFNLKRVPATCQRFVADVKERAGIK